MGLAEFGALAVVWAIVLYGWVEVARHRLILPRLWSILGRKPHTTRRGYAIRQIIFSLESSWSLTVAMTAMLAAMLLMFYLVYMKGLPDLVGLAPFLITMAAGIASCIVRGSRLSRRIGFRCAACKAQLGDGRRARFLDTGQCAVCSETVFQIRGQDTRDRYIVVEKPPPISRWRL